MSWFDATGIASLAKNALKEAQKTIDKALDIKEDGDDDASDLKSSSSSSSLSVKLSPDTSEKSDNLKVMKQSISNPILSTVTTATSASNLWGSFTGSFFDAANENNENNKAAVTIAPTSRSESRLISTKAEDKPQNSSISGRTSSASESVELLSSPLTPSSGLTSPSGNCQPSSSPSIITLQHSHKTSESIEVIKDASSSEALSPDSVISTAPVGTSASCTSISDSVEVIDVNPATFNVTSPSGDDLSFGQHDDDDESISQSYNTVSEGTASILDPSSISQQKTLNRSSLTLTLPTVIEPSNDATDSKNTESIHRAGGSLILDKSLEGLDIQTTYSDSTQSFEDVQQILLDEVNKIHSKHVTKDEAHMSPQSIDEKNPLESKATMTSDTHNSGHTSADEIETATSSDIEIISGPNGDSSSHTSSVAGVLIACKSSKLSAHSQYVVFGNPSSKKKGHYRELSEASTYSLQSESGSDGCSHSEYEKLTQKITELNEIIENRECKLVQLGRENAQIHEKNAELNSKLDALQLQVDSQGMTHTDDYTQRMSALERKFQQTLRERDNLRIEMKSIQANFSKSISKEDIDRIVKEKDTMIDELKIEGEKLSKQILQHSTITKKLRAKEKETDLQLKKQTEQIEELTLELERVKKSLSAKEDVEKSQIQAIHKLTSEKQKLNKEVAQVKSDLDDTTQRLNTIQTSFDAARKELNEKQQEHYSLEKKAKNLATLQGEQQTLQQQNQQLTTEIESLREKMKQDALQQADQVQRLRQENTSLVRRLEEIEQRSEDQAHAVTEATIPLVKQCQSLQATLNTRTLAWEKQEMTFLKKIELLEKQLANVNQSEQSANEQSDQLNVRIHNLEESLSKALLRSEQSAATIQQKQMELELIQNDAKQKYATYDTETQTYKLKVDELNANIELLQKQLKDSQEKERLYAIGMEKPKLMRKISSVEFAENSVEYSNESDHSDEQELSRIVNNSSPAYSVGKMSANDSAWQLDDLDSVSIVGQRRTPTNSTYGSVPLAFGGGSALIETLQSSLKQRDGENHQLQWELSRLQSERNFLLSEVSSLTSQLEGIKDKLETHDSVVSQFNQLQEQYDAILQMYGEKVEETEELQLDLQDVKDMYRSQIDDLLLQQRSLKQKLLESQQKGDDSST
ncbi:TATA element modulatory factor [Contarinia nasturtii]|uniref:TATA element modulatory factor n=1 Tax=Contarinia nasturtii TaxID=265458 RepID=UPI0012D44A19|nr:TATA element modulatory factor [Contarinia nasturtii]